MVRFERARKTFTQSSRPWECGNPEGISKECWKGGNPASWLSMLSILCHFHDLLFARQMLDKPIYAANRLNQSHPANQPHERVDLVRNSRPVWTEILL